MVVEAYGQKCAERRGEVEGPEPSLLKVGVGQEIVDRPDGKSEEMRTCITGAHFFAGKRVRTVEGHASDPAVSEAGLQL